MLWIIGALTLTTVAFVIYRLAAWAQQFMDTSGSEPDWVIEPIEAIVVALLTVCALVLTTGALVSESMSHRSLAVGASGFAIGASLWRPRAFFSSSRFRRIHFGATFMALMIGIAIAVAPTSEPRLSMFGWLIAGFSLGWSLPKPVVPRHTWFG